MFNTITKGGRRRELCAELLMKKALLLLLTCLLGLIALYSFFVYQTMDITKAHGMVDIQDSLLSFERPGKINVLAFDEGQQVEKGDILARLDNQALLHQIKIQQAQCHAAQALLNQYKSGYQQEERIKAKAVLNRAQASVSLAKITFERTSRLIKTNSISIQDYDKAEANYNEAVAARNEAAAALALMEKGYRTEIIEAQEAQVAACQAQLDFLHYQSENQGTIVAPFSGSLRTRLHEIADFVQRGEPIFSLTDENVKKVRLYLSRDQLSLITLKQTVTVTVASLHLPGVISFISPSAMFTPKTVQTEDLRADLVYEVSVIVPDPDHKLRFGEAVTVLLTDPQTKEQN